ncbi:MAG: hypothetical protein A4E35_01624 [Methanoregula sp. PtaU1.Bin051]|nr:MAG: hypothetical protein A4E35_01624 [Methanoregula sp. PtaU1.Bin051]
MMQIEGKIMTSHRNPSCVAGAIRIDNLASMQTESTESGVATKITGTKLRSVIASVDDYLMNLAIADEACRYGRGVTDTQGHGRTTGQKGDGVDKDKKKVR